MDRLDELTALVAILESGSLAAAGRKLRRSPPTMTRLLASLEERASARLVERTSRRLSATEAGRRLEEQARRIIGAYEDAVRDMAAAPIRGELRITAPLAFGRRHVTPIVTSFLDVYPEVQVEMVLHDGPLGLVEEGLDLAVRIGRLGDSSLVARRVGEVRRILVASPGYLAARGTPRTPADIVKHEVISGAARPLVWRFRHGGRERVVRLAPRLIVNEVDAMLIAVRGGRGLGRPLSYQVADDLASHSLVRLLPEYEPPPLPVQLVTPSAQHLAPKTRAFLDHAIRAFAALEVIR
jgi:DNA-binding transcriptional LysR family regulator